jgi:hypothetical protein
MESVDICNHFKEPLYQRGLSSESHLHQLNAMRFAAFSIWDAVQALVGTSLCGWRIEPSTHKNKLKISGNKWTFKQKGETNKIDQHRFDTSFRFGVQPVQLGVSPQHHQPCGSWVRKCKRSCACISRTGRSAKTTSVCWISSGLNSCHVKSPKTSKAKVFKEIHLCLEFIFHHISVLPCSSRCQSVYTCIGLNLCVCVNMVL